VRLVRTLAPRRERGELGHGRVRAARSAAWMPLTETGRSPGIKIAGTCKSSAFDFGRILLLPGVNPRMGLPHGGVRGTGRPSSQHVCSERHVVRNTGIVADLTVPVVRAAVARQAVYNPALYRLRRLCSHSRASKIELTAGDPNTMHDHRKLAGYGDSSSLHAPALRDSDAPSPQTRPFASAGLTIWTG
jgi:hypothetical protein